MKINTKQNAPWKLYWGPGPLPEGGEAIGVIDREGCDVGALIEIDGKYWQGNAYTLRSLPQREVIRAVAAADLGRSGGQARSKKKVAASRANGRLGGRPKKK